MKNTEVPNNSPANKAEENQRSEWQAKPTSLPPWYEWDEPTANALADAAVRLEALGWLMANTGIAPTELLPLLAMKAVEAERLDGGEIELLDLYKTEQRLTPQTASQLPHLMAYNHWRMLQVPPKDQPLDILGMLDMQTRLMTRIVPPEEVTFRTKQEVSPTSLLPLPEAKHIPEALENQSRFIVEAELPHPLVKLAFAYAQLVILQPFPQGNTVFSLLAADRLLQNWRIARLPVLNLAAYFRSAGSSYIEHLKAFQQGDEGTDWLRFFLRGLWHAADDAAETIRLSILYIEQLESQVSLLLGAAVPGGLARFFLAKPAFSEWQFASRLWLPSRDAETVLQALLGTGLVRLTHLPGDEALYYVPDALDFWETMGQTPEVSA